MPWFIDHAKEGETGDATRLIQLAGLDAVLCTINVMYRASVKHFSPSCFSVIFHCWKEFEFLDSKYNYLEENGIVNSAQR